MQRATQLRLLARLVLSLALVLIASPGAVTETSPTKLVSMPATGDVLEYELSPDDAYVVYRADPDVDGVYGIYSVAATGGTPVQLNSVPLDIRARTFQISPDGSRVVYFGDPGTGGAEVPYSVPINGPASASVQLVENADETAAIQGTTISPSGAYVVYVSDWETDNVFGLYSVPIDGPASATTKLSVPLAEDGDVYFEFQVSPDSQYVVYRADAEADTVNELYSVPITGPASASAKLHHDMVSEGFGSISGDDVHLHVISPDSSTVLFVASWYTSCWVGTQSYAYNVYELYEVPIEGPGNAETVLYKPSRYNIGYPYRTTTDPDCPGMNGKVNYLSVSPGGTQAVFTADQYCTHSYALFSVPIGGSPADVSELSGRLPCVSATESGDVTSLSITADSSRVVYLADQETIDVDELFSVPISGPPDASVKLNGELASGAEVRGLGGYQISPDGSWVVYRAGPFAEEKLYSVPIAGPASSGATLSDDLPPHRGLNDFIVEPGSQRVVYQARQDFADSVELYSVPISGYTAADVLKLNGTLVEGGEVVDFRLASDGSFVVYRADEDADEVLELFRAAHPIVVVDPDPTPDPHETPDPEETPEPGETPVPTPNPAHDESVLIPMILR